MESLFGADAVASIAIVAGILLLNNVMPRSAATSDIDPYLKRG